MDPALLHEIREILESGWSPDTAYPGQGRSGTDDGQCYVTARVLKKVFGGVILHDGRKPGHYWNRLPDETVVDFTSKQWGGDGIRPAPQLLEDCPAPVEVEFSENLSRRHQLLYRLIGRQLKELRDRRLGSVTAQSESVSRTRRTSTRSKVMPTIPPATPRHFTHYFREEPPCDEPGEPFGVLHSNLFSARGVAPGDIIYAVQIRKGRLRLFGRARVGHVLHNRKEAAGLVGVPLRLLAKADDYVLPEESTPILVGADAPVVPDSIVSQLTFLSRATESGLKFRAPGLLDGQTLRGVRVLSAASAELLDSLLPAMDRLD